MRSATVLPKSTVTESSLLCKSVTFNFHFSTTNKCSVVEVPLTEKKKTDLLAPCLVSVSPSHPVLSSLQSNHYKTPSPSYSHMHYTELTHNLSIELMYTPENDTSNGPKDGRTLQLSLNYTVLLSIVQFFTYSMRPVLSCSSCWTCASRSVTEGSGGAACFLLLSKASLPQWWCISCVHRFSDCSTSPSRTPTRRLPAGYYSVTTGVYIQAHEPMTLVNSLLNKVRTINFQVWPRSLINST